MPGIVERIRQRVGDRAVYVSVDIDVLDPAHAPGTGIPEAAGDPAANRELAAHLISDAADRGASVVVLPELVSSG